MSNQFLRDFMSRQATIIQSAAPAEEERGPKERKGKKSKYGTADGKHPFGEADALTQIITEKPHKKKVVEYFRNRIAEMVAADMAAFMKSR